MSEDILDGDGQKLSIGMEVWRCTKCGPCRGTCVGLNSSKNITLDDDVYVKYEYGVSGRESSSSVYQSRDASIEGAIRFEEKCLARFHFERSSMGESLINTRMIERAEQEIEKLKAWRNKSV